MKRHALAIIAGILCAIASAVVIDGIWRAGDEACASAVVQVRPYPDSTYEYPYSPCAADVYEAWLEPALR